MSLALLIICHPIFADKTLEEIDRVSDAIVSLMERNLKPDIKPTVNLLPFLTDDGKESTLGNRIHSNAKLHLLKNASISSSSSIDLLDTQTLLHILNHHFDICRQCLEKSTKHQNINR